jgi:rhomboid family GlyGly-CTERM serine protease
MKTGSVAFMLALLCGVMALLPHAATAWLVFDRDAILSGQIWRAWTGHLVHLSWQHAMADTLVLSVSSWMLVHRAGVRVTVRILLAGAPLIALGLLFAVPDMGVYAGASGIAMLMAAAMGGRLWLEAPRLRGPLGLLAVAVLIRMALDAGDGLPNLSTLPDGIRVVWQAHALGLLLGVWSAQWHAPRSAGTLEPGPHTALRSRQSPA